MTDKNSKDSVSETDEGGDNELVPSFVPYLAVVLGLMEKDKGSPLTEEEVNKILDGATCMMMRRSYYEKMERPYRDVNPKNVWADWHRVRSEVVSCYAPIFVLTVPVSSEVLPAAEAKLIELGMTYLVVQYRPDLVEYFRHKASKYEPVLDDAAYERIGQHQISVEIRGKSFTARESLKESLNTLKLIKDLIGIGAIAVCCDSSSLTHSNEKWLELAEEAEVDFEENSFNGLDLSAAFCRAYMQYPVESENDYFTCGLHLLGLPDLIVDKNLINKILTQPENPVYEASNLFWTFAVYLLFSCKKGEFMSGNTFSTSVEAPRFRAIWEPCSYFQESDIRYNCYGLWRFVDPNVQKAKGPLSFFNKLKR
ncbi:MAG: hypothetical protein KGS72_04325 [Cyanobacteria bacterium REEB67]|nr:hypothetical protein [Cyanobacteria bacterium REEB67]